MFGISPASVMVFSVFSSYVVDLCGKRTLGTQAATQIFCSPDW